MQRGKIPFLLVMLGLPLALFAMFVLSPFVQTFYLATTDWTGYTPSYNAVGLRNFQWIVETDGRFWAGLRNNLVLLVVVPAITLALSLLFATLLNLSGSTKAGQVRGVPGAGFYRILFFMPQVISVVALGIMFQQVLQPHGLLNSLLHVVGVDAPSWLADPRTALAAVVAVMVWMNVGFYMVFFSAAMASIPRELFEAAAIDKANSRQTFFRITLPLLWPAVQTAIVYLAIMCLDVLAIVQVMTIGPGGPNDTTTVMALSLLESKNEGLFGYASAQGVVIFAITLVLAALMLRITRREQVQM